MLFFKNYKFNFNNTLHIAPERVLINLLKENSQNYICGDINHAVYKKKNIKNVIKLDVTKLKYSNKFDLVFASHILEHIIDDKLAMSEIYKSLTTGGRFITMIPQNLTLKSTYEDSTIKSKDERTKHFGQCDHVRRYGLDFSERLKEVGFYIKVYYIEDNEENIKNMIYDEKIMIATKIDKKKYVLQSSNIIYECIKN
jgi:predicted SAM-dependent methyltransferase